MTFFKVTNSEAFGCLKDNSSVCKHFSYCQQIVWKHQNKQQVYPTNKYCLSIQILFSLLFAHILCQKTINNTLTSPASHANGDRSHSLWEKVPVRQRPVHMLTIQCNVLFY